jgi:hypothetical protein
MSAYRYGMAARVRAPKSERERREILALQGFIDESQADGQVLVMAGYLATAAAWEKFTDDWIHCLSGPPSWPMLKSVGAERKLDIDPGFKRRYMAHRQIILNHVQAEICVAIPIDAFEKVFDRYGLKRRDRNPYFLAINTLFSLYAGHAWKSRLNESVEFIFDDRSEKAQIMRGWESYKKSMPHRHRRLVGDQPVFRKDYKFRPLQAADFIAYWKRREYLEKKTIRGHLGPVLPWDESEPPYACIYGELDEDGIEHFMASHYRHRSLGYRARIHQQLPYYGWSFSGEAVP